ncbi:aldo/keto reductase [Xanthomonas sp. WHRI 1810A]|uniref:aldo/keto reductase n=1 Tax=Xanthomonas sp. WHRI 1810A TaxID=3161565 RepID=UPI0032E93871
MRTGQVGCKRLVKSNANGWSSSCNCPDGAREANHHLVTLIDEIAQRKQATPAQIALAWLLAQKPWIAPIPGTTKLHRLEENVGGATVELTVEDLRELGEVLAKVPVQGERYTAQMMKTINR